MKRSAPAPTSASLPRVSSFAQFSTLLRKDLTREFRTRDMLLSMGIYAVLVLLVYGAALGTVANGVDIVRISGGLLWVLVVFTSLLGLNRAFAYEKEEACIEGLLLAPLDRSAIFLAKATSNFLFILLVEVVAVPLFMFFFLSGAELAPTAPFGLIPLIVGTLGMAGVGTMLSTISMHTRARDVMLAVLMIPVLYPLLFSCVTATTAALAGAGTAWTDLFTMPLVMACGYDVVMIALSWVLYGFVIES